MLAARLNLIVPSEMHPVMLVMNNFPVRTQVRVTSDSSFSIGTDHLTIFLSFPPSFTQTPQLRFSAAVYFTFDAEARFLLSRSNSSNLIPFSPGSTVSSTSLVLFYHLTQTHGAAASHGCLPIARRHYVIHPGNYSKCSVWYLLASLNSLQGSRPSSLRLYDAI